MTEILQAIINFFGQFKFFVTILPWEVAVRTRLGNRVRVWEPGWHIKMPFIDDVKVVNTRLRVVHTTPQTVTTADGKQVTIAFVLGFSITKPKETLLRLIEPETTLVAVVQSAVARYVWELPAASLSIPGIEAHALSAVNIEGIAPEFVRVADFVVARTYRLIQATDYGRSGTMTGERVL